MRQWANVIKEVSCDSFERHGASIGAPYIVFRPRAFEKRTTMICEIVLGRQTTIFGRHVVAVVAGLSRKGWACVTNGFVHAFDRGTLGAVALREFAGICIPRK